MTGVICLTVVLSVFALSKVKFFIRNDNKLANTISTSGDGKVVAKPDMVEMNISFTESGATSKAALENVNKKISLVTEVLKSNKIDNDDIKTTNVQLYTEYDYTGGTRILKGQRASQSLNFKVKKIDEKMEKVSKVIDEVSAINGIQVGGISFDIEDKTKYYSEARKLAFEKSKQKANELAGLAKVNLGKPSSISDSVVDISARPYLNYAAAKSNLETVSDETQIQSGTLELSVNLDILWEIE